MRFSAVIVALSAAFATASAAHLERRQTGYASCALPCLTSADRGSCAADDTKCLCNNQTFVNETTLCFEKNCTGDDLDKSIAAAVEMCRSVGVTLTSTPTSSPTGSSSTSTPSPSGSSSSSNNGAISNGVNVLFALSALGLIGYAL